MRWLVSFPKVRQHLRNAGRECGLAIQAGLQGLKGQVRAKGLGKEYPYLQGALENVGQMLERWMGAAGGKRRRRPTKKG